MWYCDCPGGKCDRAALPPRVPAGCGALQNHAHTRRVRGHGVGPPPHAGECRHHAAHAAAAVRLLRLPHARLRVQQHPPPHAAQVPPHHRPVAAGQPLLRRAGPVDAPRLGTGPPPTTTTPTPRLTPQQRGLRRGAAVAGRRVEGRVRQRTRRRPWRHRRHRRQRGRGAHHRAAHRGVAAEGQGRRGDQQRVRPDAAGAGHAAACAVRPAGRPRG